MAYEKTTWVNREVEKPRTFNKVTNSDGTITLVPAEGNIIEEGTPIIASNMNNIEEGIEAAHSRADAAFQSASDGKSKIATAITGKGVVASPSDTFPTLATKIGQIETDKTGDANALATQILLGRTAYVKGSKITGTIPSKAAATITPGKTAQTITAGQYLSGIQTIPAVPVPAANVLTGTTIAGTAGTMPNRGAVNISLTTPGQVYTVPAGYHSGAGKVTANVSVTPKRYSTYATVKGNHGRDNPSNRTFYVDFPRGTINVVKSDILYAYMEGVSISGLDSRVKSGISDAQLVYDAISPRYVCSSHGTSYLTYAIIDIDPTYSSSTIRVTIAEGIITGTVTITRSYFEVGYGSGDPGKGGGTSLNLYCK